MNNIFILSEPVRSGKTTILIQYFLHNKEVKGVVCPDLENKRKLFLIEEQILYPLEIFNTSNPNIQHIGRFHFNGNSFIEAQISLIALLKKEATSYLLIDEVGKLEISHGQGFEPGLTEIIEYYKKSTSNCKLILVIRDFLLEEAIEHYGLQKADIIRKDFFDNVSSAKINSSINGLVLCGGESSRMGSPKALLKYHKQPQYKVVYELLKPLCKEVHISCKKEQSGLFDPTLPQYHDDEQYKNAGPFAAILSAFKKNNDDAILLVGCDYPAFKKEDLALLVQTFYTFNKSCCYVSGKDKNEEPLLAIYHPSDFSKLVAFYQSGELSLRKFLSIADVIKIVPEYPQNIISYDTVASYKSWP